MELSFYLIQLLNGIQYGFLLFLVASGLTLVFGIMDVINLAHGSFYMIGAYLAFWLTGIFDNLLLDVSSITIILSLCRKIKKNRDLMNGETASRMKAFSQPVPD